MTALSTIRSAEGLDALQLRAADWLGANSRTILRLLMGMIFLAFGLLKFFPGVSPAEGMAVATFDQLTLGLLPDELSRLLVATFETVLGRRRYFPELHTKGSPEQMRRRAEREAINHPVQGSAADIMKIAMINIHRALKAGNYQARMTLQVHDELVFDCPQNELDEVEALIAREMEGAYTLSVHLKAEVKDGKNWDET